MIDRPAPIRHTLRVRAPGAVTAVGAAVAGVAASYASAGASPGFVAGPIANLLARRLPGVVITGAILLLGDLGHTLNVVTAVAIAILILAGTTVTARWLTDRLVERGETWLATGRPRWAPDAVGVEPEWVTGAGSAVLAGAFAVVVAAAITGATGPSLLTGVATGAVVALGAVAHQVPSDGGRLDDVRPGRRRILATVIAGLSVGVAGYLLGRRPTPGPTGDVPAAIDTSETAPLLSKASERSLDVTGLEPLVSESFYEVDINSVNPEVSLADWSLTIRGAVESERTFTVRDLRRFEASHRFVTLRCVGEQLNGHKMDNALWTGVPMMRVLEAAGLEFDDCCVMLRAVDNYYEEFPLAALRNGFLAYGMNGEVLPRAHGYPVRALVPGHWGEINVKWLTDIEVLESPEDGYWESRGWHGTGPVNTVAKLHVVNEREETIQVGGHAYAGTRSVSAVEVSTDGGDRWHEARLSDPLPGADVWRQWEHTYEPPDGPHEVVVRAIDGTGTVQPEQRSSPFPSGPSGWVYRSIDP